MRLCCIAKCDILALGFPAYFVGNPSVSPVVARPSRQRRGLSRCGQGCVAGFLRVDCERSEAIHCVASGDAWIASSLAPRNDEWIIVSRFSRRMAPEVCIFVCPPRNQRAQGRPGACCTRGLACDLRITKRTRAYRAAGTLRPSLRNGFTAYFVLSPENGSFASVAREKLASPELDASTAASGPHDFAVRFEPHTSVAALASIASHRTFVTIANAPLGRETSGVMPTDLRGTKAEYFLFPGLTRFPKIGSDLPVVPAASQGEAEACTSLHGLFDDGLVGKSPKLLCPPRAPSLWSDGFRVRAARAPE